MIIDCDECMMQHTVACDDCVVGSLLVGEAALEVVEVEIAALENLARAGLVPPIRLVARGREADSAAG